MSCCVTWWCLCGVGVRCPWPAGAQSLLHLCQLNNKVRVSFLSTLPLYTMVLMKDCLDHDSVTEGCDDTDTQTHGHTDTRTHGRMDSLGVWSKVTFTKLVFFLHPENLVQCFSSPPTSLPHSLSPSISISLFFFHSVCDCLSVSLPLPIFVSVFPPLTVSLSPFPPLSLHPSLPP